KVKKEGNMHYEMLFIIPNKYTDNEAVEIASKIKTIVSENGGEITHEANWGKKKLAYPIDRNHHGYYNLIEFDAEREKLAKIDRLLRMMSEVLRHQIVRKKLKTIKEIEEEKKIAEKIAAKSMEKIEAEEKEEKAKKQDEKPEKKVDLEDLDEKLDKILDTGDLL
ncbi:MAG: 30S ribosomal protein S6, partial [Candidatus Omnitrophica bacterium]|nr:30S ribosomal protein S6 [Candidatus Omnitrophota bacterium]